MVCVILIIITVVVIIVIIIITYIVPTMCQILPYPNALIPLNFLVKSYEMDIVTNPILPVGKSRYANSHLPPNHKAGKKQSQVENP